MTRRTGVAILVLVVMAVAGSLAGRAAEPDMAVIKQRQDVMKEIVKHFKAIKVYAEGGNGSPDDVARRAARIAELAKRIPSLFPKGTGRPEVDPKLTRALPTIWQDWSGFEAASRALEREAGKLVKVAQGGDPFAIADQFVVTGKKGCGGCHKSFRGKKVE